MNTNNQTPADQLTVSNVVARVAAPTPPFWKTVRNIWLWITGAAATVALLPAAGVAIPVAILTGAKLVTTVAAVAAAQAQATTATPPTPASNDTSQAAQ